MYSSTNSSSSSKSLSSIDTLSLSIEIPALIISLIPLVKVNLGIVFSGIITVSPVLGLIPLRSARTLTLNFPIFPKRTSLARYNSRIKKAS